MAGLTVVPVVVLDVSDQQVEVLRTQENLRRRGLKPSETARAIRRLYELHGISENKGGRPTKETPAESAGVSPKTQEDVARDAGVSPRKAQRLNRIADLIGPLMRLLDHGDGTLHLVATPSNLLAHSVPRRARRRQQRKVWQYCQTFLCWPTRGSPATCVRYPALCPFALNLHQACCFTAGLLVGLFSLAGGFNHRWSPCPFPRVLASQDAPPPGPPALSALQVGGALLSHLGPPAQFDDQFLFGGQVPRQRGDLPILGDEAPVIGSLYHGEEIW